MSYTVDIKGMTELVAKLDKLPAQLTKEVNGILQMGAEVFVLNAKRDAPKDFAGGGGLTGGISFYPNPVTGLGVAIASSVFYSPYMEWGTIYYAAAGVNYVSNLSGLKDLPAYAIQFKGKGIRKNGGIFPRAFFFKQLPLAKATIEKGFDSILKDVKL